MRTPSSVRLVSAIEVARTSLRRPGGGGGDGGALRGGIEAAVKAVEIDVGGQARRAARRCARSRRRRAGRRAGCPPLSPSARRMAAAISSSIRLSAARPRWMSSIGWLRPSLSITGAPPIKRREAGAVERRRHGEQAQVRAAARACASSASARPKSLSRLRSCTSSNSTAETPASSGSAWMRFRKMPSVRTSDPGPRRALAVEPGGIADRPADRLAGQLRHPLGGGAGGEPARRQQQDLAAAPGLAEQGRRDRRRLARAGRRDQHRALAVRRRAAVQVRQDRIGWEGPSRTPHALATVERSGRLPSISAGDRELDRLDQRGLGAAGGEGAERVDRALAVMAGALDRVVERAASRAAAGSRAPDRRRRRGRPPSPRARRRAPRPSRAHKRGSPAASPCRRGNRRRRPCPSSPRPRHSRSRRRPAGRRCRDCGHRRRAPPRPPRSRSATTAAIRQAAANRAAVLARDDRRDNGPRSSRSGAARSAG